MAAAASAARRARARASSGATAASGPRTRTGSCSACWRRRSRRSPDAIPGEHYAELTARLGAPVYTRIDTPCTPAEKAAFRRLTPEAITATTLAGDPIEARLTRAPGNGAPIGGLKVTTAQGWFAARPSGTENVYKLYAESFRDAGAPGADGRGGAGDGGGRASWRREAAEN